MKGARTPQCYLGGDVLELGGKWEAENITTAFLAETCVRNALPRLVKACGIEQFKMQKMPFSDTHYLS